MKSIKLNQINTINKLADILNIRTILLCDNLLR